MPADGVLTTGRVSEGMLRRLWLVSAQRGNHPLTQQLDAMGLVFFELKARVGHAERLVFEKVFDDVIHVVGRAGQRQLVDASVQQLIRQSGNDGLEISLEAPID